MLYTLQPSPDQITICYFDLFEITIFEAEMSDRPWIFNLDEKGFPLNTKPPEMTTKKGEKHPICYTGHDKSQIPFLLCYRPSGYAIPPLVIYDKKPELTAGEVPGRMYG